MDVKDQGQSPENNAAHTTNDTQLQEQLQACFAQRDEWKDRALRVSAEFENYKKRSEKEKSWWITSSQATILTDLLAVVDDFDRAFEQINTTEHAAQNTQWITGFQLIHKSFQKMLEKYGVKEIQSNKSFDPTLHEAIMHVESPDHSSGDVVKVLQKGYTFKDQVLRPAKVSVAK